MRKEFIEAVNDDLNTPKALAVLWQVLKSNIPSTDKYDLALYFDEVLGLELSELTKTKIKIPMKAKELVTKREKLRAGGEFGEADKARNEIRKLGFDVEDTSKGPRLKAVKN